MINEESAFKALKWCVGVAVLGLPGTVYYYLLRLRYEPEWFKDRGVMMSRIWASMFSLALGVVGVSIVAPTLLILRGQSVASGAVLLVDVLAISTAIAARRRLGSWSAVARLGLPLRGPRTDGQHRDLTVRESVKDLFVVLASTAFWGSLAFWAVSQGAMSNDGTKLVAIAMGLLIAIPVSFALWEVIAKLLSQQRQDHQT